MDILAHGLWAGAGVALIARRRPVSRGTALATVALAMLPDVVQMLPLLRLAFDAHGLSLLERYATATPGLEPALPPGLLFVSHHLHCALHSAPVAAVVTLLVLTLRLPWLPLLGWWSHIVIDVFTHSRSFYPAPVLYPLSDWSFDGIAWNTPWFEAANYAALALAIGALALAYARDARTGRRRGWAAHAPDAPATTTPPA